MARTFKSRLRRKLLIARSLLGGPFLHFLQFRIETLDIPAGARLGEVVLSSQDLSQGLHLLCAVIQIARDKVIFTVDACGGTVELEPPIGCRQQQLDLAEFGIDVHGANHGKLDRLQEIE